MINFYYMQDIAKRVESVHGGGINYDYRIECNGDNMYFHNAYDYMNENGFYDGVIPFTLIVSLKRDDDIRIVFHADSRMRHKAEDIGLKGYLEGTYSAALYE